MSKTSLLIMAAGLGSRFGGIKQITPIGPYGETLLEYSIYDALLAGFDEIVFLIRSEIEEDFKKLIIANIDPSISYKISFQENDKLINNKSLSNDREKPWGTGHAMLCCYENITNPFAIINADDYYGRESFKVLHKKLSQIDSASSDFFMVAYVLEKTLSKTGPVSRALCQIENGYLRGIVENTNIFARGDKIVSQLANGKSIILEKESPVSMNLWGFSPKIFIYASELFNNFVKYISQKNVDISKIEFGLPSIIEYIIVNNYGHIEVLKTNEEILGMTYKEDLDKIKLAIQDKIKANIYPKALWK